MPPVQTEAPNANQAMRARMYRTWTLWGYGVMAVIAALALLLTIVAPATWNALELPVVLVFAAVVIFTGFCRLRGKQLA